MFIHYALQTCDINNNQVNERICDCSKTELVKKCVSSFLQSVKHCSVERPEATHIINIIDDHSSAELIEFLNRVVKKYNSDNVVVRLTPLETHGVMESIRFCYEWLEANGMDLVYQVQDDYLFEKTAILEMIDVFMQMNNDCDTHPIVTSYNYPFLWLADHMYRYRSTPRTIVPGAMRYWIQIYDIPCTFMTSKMQFSRHWDLYERFFQCNPKGPELEDVSLNKMLVERGVLGLSPFNSLALHIQGEQEKDPYIDWKSKWDAIQVD